jgi:hypothetical protein
MDEKSQLKGIKIKDQIKKFQRILVFLQICSRRFRLLVPLCQVFKINGASYES